MTSSNDASLPHTNTSTQICPHTYTLRASDLSTQRPQVQQLGIQNFGSKMSAAECLRKYMKHWNWKDSSTEVNLLGSQMDANKSLRDEWIKEEWDFKRKRRRIVYSHTLMYTEMKVRLNQIEAAAGTEVIVSDALFKLTEDWLKEKYVKWRYNREEEYPAACSGRALDWWFRLPNPKPARPDIKDVGYYRADFTRAFIQMAAKVVAVDAAADVLEQEIPRQLERENRRLQPVVEYANNRCEVARSEAAHVKVELELVERSDTQLQRLEQVKEELENAELEASSLQLSLPTEIEPAFRPTPEEIQVAKQKVLFEPSCFHVALVGRSGGGGASIFEALTTVPGVTLIRHNGLEALKFAENVIFFHLPSWGSQITSQHRYFERFNLLAFDAVFLVIDGKLLETDLNILRHCQNLAIPFHLIRTKCDLEILRMRADLENGNHKRDLDDYFKGPDATFRSEVNLYLSRKLYEARLKETKVYLINSQSLQGRIDNRRDKVDLLLDEEAFIEDLKRFPNTSSDH
eukprot:Gregarina_sp_Pseudo_9__128@NODE_1088_length_1885_cov_46_502709_g1018_i0_p1_GENE_NODE_1088_length_1885_cov_46_502709_g1018_i0NODE_1088_length_1885_cov_46_502709_g1018_i0_p1_ORF_typecomplete_len517_score60_42IIGP/PF05049_13/4_4e03IIGP/PF05049_13/1_8e18FeoB_N/PF02421_18/0_027KxDL/PF10241_9/0_067CENPF_leu_zip/PF10473_9/0_51DivIVA/PF05103_13/4_5_NODE_1088_length_1885_cov_46_502709_g1018_i0871637